MKPKWHKLASLAQGICTLWFQFFDAVFASKGYPFKNIFEILFNTAPLVICIYRLNKTKTDSQRVFIDAQKWCHFNIFCMCLLS